MSASTLPSPRSRRLGLLFSAALAAALASARSTWAADDVVRLSCPDLTTERAAELESRVRANLLTAELAATVLISCQPDGTDVRVASSTDNLTVHVPPTLGEAVDTFRDDVLRAVEEALAELSRRAHMPAATDSSAAPAAREPAPAMTEEPTPAPPVAAISTLNAPALAQQDTPPTASVTRAWTEVSGVALGESWRDHWAIGGALGIARRTPDIWYRLRASVLRPTAGTADFGATDCSAAAELGLQPRFSAGVQLTVGLGPSVLFVTPHDRLIARHGTATTALFVEARLSRPVWIGRFALLPELGGRLFTGERGVRIDTQQRLTLPVLVPEVVLGLIYRVD